MKNTILKVLGLAFALTLSFTSVVGAEERDKGVGQEFVVESRRITQRYENYNNLHSAFNEMAPGDTYSVSIKITNNSGQELDFYVKQETLDALEKSNNSARGADYQFDLTLKSTGESLLDAEAGGYSDETKASGSDKGLYDVEISGYTFFKTLKNGESEELVFTLHINGTTTNNDYMSTFGAIEPDFQVVGPDTPTPTIINQPPTTTVVNTPTPSVRTGDNTPIIAVVGLLAVGIILVVVSSIRKRKAD